jgi:hypothetical protein
MEESSCQGMGGLERSRERRESQRVGSRNYEPSSGSKDSWESIDGSPNSGTITFDELGDNSTRVNATIGYEPEGFLEKTGDALGIPSGRIEGDLQRFRNYVEERGRETGGWRGQIRQVEKSGLGILPTTGSRLEGGTEQPYAAEHPVSETRVSAQPGETAGESTIEVPLSEEEVKVGKRTVARNRNRPKAPIIPDSHNASLSKMVHSIKLQALEGSSRAL